ncbi:hypothetical protein A5707_07180 [Mycobacterium kyorinense]|uniref:TIR domain-containing protein n=1 Tax=Mycobacterium kyorinense TaxID=487514 RepID=A0A1A2YVQ6_9MYCO|nr:sensor domain-containing protein [Mycobacterium kyorinense]OBI41498.1 hypothetical protein A5707_07180 [Mycobacterium kyorinense]
MLFVSYASQDRAAINHLLTTLRHARHQVWLDDELAGGEAWWRTILERIRGSAVFIIALSNNSLASKPCKAELRYAEALRRPILPVQIGPVDSVRVTPLAATQIFDYRAPTRQANAKLLAVVQKRQAEFAPLPSPLPAEPPVPFAYLMRLASTLARPELNGQQQAELVWELKTRLDEDRNDPNACEDITRLLRRLQERPDVTWRIRTEIDGVLASLDANLPVLGSGAVGPLFSGPLPVVRPSAFSGPQPVVTLSAHDVPPAEKPGTGRTRRPRKKWIIAGSAGLAAAVAIVLAVVLTGPKLDPLDSILLKDSEVNAIMGTSEMKTVETGKEAVKQSSLVRVSQPDCMGALYPGLDRTYQGSGVKQLSWKVLEKPGGLQRAGDRNDHFVDQDVAAFAPGSEQAVTFVQSSAKQWQGCAGQTVTVTYPDQRKYTWNFGGLTGEAPTISQRYTQIDNHGFACQRVLSAVSTFVIDVKACGNHITDEASRIAGQIAANATEPFSK